jgi:hypothetical protein
VFQLLPALLYLLFNGTADPAVPTHEVVKSQVSVARMQLTAETRTTRVSSLAVLRYVLVCWIQNEPDLEQIEPEQGLTRPVKFETPQQLLPTSFSPSSNLSRDGPTV